MVGAKGKISPRIWKDIRTRRNNQTEHHNELGQQQLEIPEEGTRTTKTTLETLTIEGAHRALRVTGVIMDPQDNLRQARLVLQDRQAEVGVEGAAVAEVAEAATAATAVTEAAAMAATAAAVVMVATQSKDTHTSLQELRTEHSSTL
jgi:hypothetical protein